MNSIDVRYNFEFFCREEFVHFASTCFKNFGDRVKYWATINEPNLFSELAYMKGIFPPSHCSPPFGKCGYGNSDIEPLLVVHNSILAHAKAVKIYRDQFQVSIRVYFVLKKNDIITNDRAGGTTWNDRNGCERVYV